MKIGFLSLFFWASLFAGDIARIEIPRITYLQAELIPAHNSIGFSNILVSDAAELASANPASIANFTHPRFGVAFDYFAPIKLNYGIKLSMPSSWYPRSAALVMPVKNFHFGLSYQRRYAALIDYGKIEISTIEQPSGSGTYIYPTASTNVYEIGAVFGVDFQEVLFDNDRLTLAFMWNSSYLDIRDKFGETSGTLNDFAQGQKVGLIYQFNPTFGMGIMYESAPKFKAPMEYDPKLVTAVNSLTKNVVRLDFANYVAFGFRLNLLRRFPISINWEYLILEQVNSNYKNSINFSAGVVYRVSNVLDISIGLLDANFGMHSGTAANMDALFLNLGLRRRLSFGDIRIGIYDSHLSVAETHQQTTLKFGLNILLDK